MDMIRWLATNKVVLAVWGLGILAMLLAFIFGGGKKAEPEMAAVETKTVEAVADTSKSSAAAVTAAATSTAAVAVASTVQAAADTTPEATEKVSAETKVADEAAAKSETKVAETVDSAATDASAIADDQGMADKSSDDLLMMAREAYWDNGLDQAATLYSELITREPSVIEHKGELGNVFWRQGYPKKAAELYADIAQPMIESGNGERVSNMVGFIGLFFPERATSIRKLLDAQ